MLRNTNRVVSIYRGYQKIETLIRVNNVTGTEFPVSGDAPLRDSWERLTHEERLALIHPVKHRANQETPC